ncbi:hypothetical protein DSM43518_04578 [Mycobacterium marinum]|uniref:hypothetical protein n=1 Tax=Mycobacterium marinum TaxID=1781 RepID=UPI000E3DAC0D|nr:hypothetical protein [Mycobacterium marinum]RFZ03863.1 hypothetical protein DSM43518_04578 [Mycobacterium marinum]
MDSWEPEVGEVERVRDAVRLAGDLNYLRVHPTAMTEFYAAIVGFLGGSLDDIDAFLTQPDEPDGAHRVYWLRGNSFGSLALEAHDGPDGANEPAKVSGFVRSLDDVRKVEVLGITTEWPFSGGIPRIYPEVSVHFEDDIVTIRASQGSHAAAQRQAAEFVGKLMEAITRRA